MKAAKLKQNFLLFKITLSISAFTFGGGYIAIPMMREHFVEDLKLISDQELLDMAAIAQSTPGAIAVNIAVLVGYRISGITGAIISCIGTILPPILILSVISVFYKAFRDNKIISAILKGMQSGAAAIIVDLVVDMYQGIIDEKNWLLTFMAPITFVANFIFDINVIIIIVSCSVLCVIQNFIRNMVGGVENE